MLTKPSDVLFLSSYSKMLFTVFTHAHAAIGGEVATAGVCYLLQGLPISDIQVIQVKGSFLVPVSAVLIIFPFP